jgi:DNA-directed RNA polymerase specialized sigma24 family protein
MSAAPTSETHEHLLRPLAPEVLALLVRRYGPFDACEDAVQEALLAAVKLSSGRRRGFPRTRVRGS